MNVQCDGTAKVEATYPLSLWCWFDWGSGSIPVSIGSRVQPPRFAAAGRIHYGIKGGTSARPVGESPGISGIGGRCRLAVCNGADAR